MIVPASFVSAGLMQLMRLISQRKNEPVAIFGILDILAAMGKMTNRQRLHIWIACFAILLNALVPSISHAVNAFQSRDALSDICSAEGARYVAPDGSPVRKSPLDTALHHMAHCPCCVSDASAPPLPPRVASLLPLTRQSHFFPSLSYRSPAPLFAWSQSHPRAPPVR